MARTTPRPEPRTLRACLRALQDAATPDAEWHRVFTALVRYTSPEWERGVRAAIARIPPREQAVTMVHSFTNLLARGVEPETMPRRMLATFLRCARYVHAETAAEKERLRRTYRRGKHEGTPYQVTVGQLVVAHPQATVPEIVDLCIALCEQDDVTFHEYIATPWGGGLSDTPCGPVVPTGRRACGVARFAPHFHVVDTQGHLRSISVEGLKKEIRAARAGRPQPPPTPR
jgi:hypothetical protein